MWVTQMGEVWFYKGLYKVKVLTESEGYWIVEALEEFEDTFGCEKIIVKIGQQRIVPVEALYKRKYLAPPVKEHVYELKMEKKLKRLITQEEKKYGTEE
jgi:hypothetical protein